MILLKSENVSVPLQSFYRTILLFITSPQAANKKICGSVIENVAKLNQNSNTEDAETLSVDDLKQLDLHLLDPPFRISITSIILPKNVTQQKFKVVSIIERGTCCFCRIKNEEKGLLPEFDYKIAYSEDKLSLWEADNSKEFETYEKSSTWLTTVLFKKFLKWMGQDDVNPEKQPPTRTIKSLQLIDSEEYNQLYAELKNRYSQYLINMWTECTDPQKYIYEDLGIAAYLILLWRKERAEQNATVLQSFVDIGCGNGLLVYILSNEGHPGLGIDLRKRKIWKQYPPESVKLKEETITPSASSLFPQTDWIIGNHSDELSPWIPVISAKSSSTSRFFLLPCCAYEFNGEKYKRRKNNQSVYEDFLGYLKEISSICGFKCQNDRLKIPSTKRIAIVGFNRNITDVQFQSLSESIQKFIDDSCIKSTDNSWCHDFKPREQTEKVSNCSTVDKNVEAKIIDLIFQKLMTKKRLTEFPNWNLGGTLELNDAVQLVPRELRSQLKSENGGLQTLLRNNHSIFEVRRGIVQLRKPVSLFEKLKQHENSGKNFTFQMKPCWFLSHHPDGCPFTAEECSYSHESGDIKYVKSVQKN